MFKHLAVIFLFAVSCIGQTNYLLTASQYTRIRGAANPNPIPDGSTPAYWDKLYNGLNITFTNIDEVPIYTISPAGTTVPSDKKAKVVAVIVAKVPGNQWKLFDFGDKQVIPSAIEIFTVRMDTNSLSSVAAKTIVDESGRSAMGIQITPTASALNNLSVADSDFMQYVDVQIKHNTAVWWNGQLKLGSVCKSTIFDEFYVIEWRAVDPTLSYNVFTMSYNYGSVAGEAANDSYFTIIITAKYDGTKGIR